MKKHFSFSNILRYMPGHSTLCFRLSLSMVRIVLYFSNYIFQTNEIFKGRCQLHLERERERERVHKNKPHEYIMCDTNARYPCYQSILSYVIFKSQV